MKVCRTGRVPSAWRKLKNKMKNLSKEVGIGNMLGFIAFVVNNQKT